MAALSLRKGNTRLPPEVNRVLYVRNLPFNITSEEMYDIFGKYGAIRQIRIGTNKDTRGTAFVVYEDIYDAKTAVDHLSGFNVANRVLYVRNEMYDIFGKYGAIRQICIGTNKDTRGTAFVFYEDIYDAKTAIDRLSGFNVANRYLIVLYYQQAKMSKKFDQKKKEDEITKLQEKYGIPKDK